MTLSAKDICEELNKLDENKNSYFVGLFELLKSDDKASNPQLCVAKDIFSCDVEYDSDKKLFVIISPLAQLKKKQKTRRLK